MAKNSGGTRASSRVSDSAILQRLPITVDYFGETEKRANREAFNNALLAMGNSRESIEQVERLLHQHSGDSYEQGSADPIIEREINDPNSPIGKVLRDRAHINEVRFTEYMKVKARADKENIEEAKRPFYDEAERRLYGWKTPEDAASNMIMHVKKNPPELRIYRGGGRKNVESWTYSSEGALVAGRERIIPNMVSTVKEMLKTHYLVAGFSTATRYADEQEVIFVKKKKK